MDFKEVQDYILGNIFFVDQWKELDQLGEDADRIKQVVVNNAEAILYRELPHHFSPTKPIPMDVYAEQCLHILSQDDSTRRASKGVSYFMASGLYLSFDKNYKDWDIPPSILKRYPRRRTGQYVLGRGDTNRTTHALPKTETGKTWYE
jgi:hypothetical protein